MKESWCYNNYYLARLKYLNLDNNEIYTIPRLKLLGTNLLRPFSRAYDQDRATGDLQTDNRVPILSPQPPETEGNATGREAAENDVLVTTGGMGRLPSIPQSPVEDKVGKKDLHTASAPAFKEAVSVEGKERERKMHAQSLVIKQPPSEQAANSILRPGTTSTDDSIPMLGSDSNSTPATNNADRGGDTNQTDVEFEQWSPSPALLDSRQGSDLFPYPVLETLSLVNNLVSLL